jgi:hypothetical protein
VSTRLLTLPPADLEDFDFGMAASLALLPLAPPAVAAAPLAPAPALGAVLEGTINRLPFSRRSKSSSRCFFSVSMLDGS